MEPLVSVVVPIYKVERDLRSCIDSIINQTYQNLEIILVDDGSPDCCGEIIDEYALIDKRVKTIHKENGGLSDARNKGMEYVTGEYITFVDSDDKLELHFTERLMKLMYSHHAEVAVCKNSVFTYDNCKISQNREKKVETKLLSGIDACSNMLYQKDFDVSAWGKIYSISLFNNVKYPKGLIHEDIPTTYKVIAKAENVVYTSEELYCYQIRENSIENEKFSLKKMDCITTAQMMLDDIYQRIPELSKAGRSRYFAANMHILAQIDSNIPQKRLIKNNIKKVRKRIIFDRNATNRVRIACLLTCINFEITIKLLNILNKNKYA